MLHSGSANATLAADHWGATLSGVPVLDMQVKAVVPALVRRWQAIDPLIDQASLDHHFISLHLGGAKRLYRRGEGRQETRDVALGAHSVIPAGAAFHWNTEGPVDFAHIYFAPSTVAHVIADSFDRDPAGVSFTPALGEQDGLMHSLGLALLDELAVDHRQQAYLDDLLHLILCRALKLHSDAGRAGAPARHTLAPFRLRRAIDFIESHLGDPIGVEDIAEASGISRFHFSRAFRDSMGRPPYAYLLDRRLALARQLLIDGTCSLGDVAARCGFANPSQFARAFRRATGVCPSDFRRRA